MGKLITGLLVLFLLLVSGACAGETTPPTSPAPVPAPAPGPSPSVMFERSPDVVGPYGEKVEINLSFVNEASAPRTISPFPPEVRIIELTNLRPPDTVVRAFPVGSGEHTLQSGESVSYAVDWDQKNDGGEQVLPGWYSVEVTLATSRGSAARVLVLPPEGVMEKTIEVNQSQTVNGITITLERVELTTTGMKVYAFNAPPDYNLPQGPMLPPPMLMIHAEAEYGTDGGAMKQTFPSGIRFLDNGMEHTWGEYLDPVPKNAKELTFRITRLGDWEGPWEFAILLDPDSSNDQNVTVSQLVAQANSYNGKVVTIDAFYFYAIMEANALADSVDLTSEGKIVPVGVQIRVRGNISQEILNQLYTQESPAPTRTEFFGKLKITGKFEIDDKDGQYYVNMTGTELLEWAPPFTDNGNLQINIQGSFSNKSLESAKVVSGKQPEGQQKLTGLTGADGTATFNDVKQGRYEFTVSLADHLPIEIKVAVTGGRTADVAYSMAHVGEAPDDLLPAPGMGPQYRTNLISVRKDGTQRVNPWPPIEGATVTLGASPDAVQITYRGYIETEAGQTRNNMIIVYVPGIGPGEEPFRHIEVTLSSTDLPSGIIATQDWQYVGASNNWNKTALKIVISSWVEPGEYIFNVGVEVDGKYYGTVPCTINVLP